MATNGKWKNGSKNGPKNGKKANGKGNGRTAAKATNGAHNDRWVYAYELDPPQPEPRFKKIHALFKEAHAAAKRKGRLWTGRIVTETLLTHLLIVTDNPEHVPAVNKAIEMELKHLNMGFALNGPARLPLSRVTFAPRASRSSSRSSGRVSALEKSSVPSR